MVPGWDDPQDDLSISPKGNALMLLNPVIDNGPGGWSPRRFGDTYRQYSPFYFVSPSVPPTIVMSGTEDKLAHATMLRQFKEQMEKAGVRCDLILYDGQEHGFFNKEPYTTKTDEAMAAFLVSLHYLKAN